MKRGTGAVQAGPAACAQVASADTRGTRVGPRHRRSPIPASGGPAAEDGNTIVEFVVLAAALLIPALYLVLTLGSVQAAVFAADTIARDAARIHAVEPDPDHATMRARQHTAMILEDYRLEASEVVRISCSEDPCSSPGGTVSARVRIPVPVPGLGPILGETGPVAVGASHAVQVDQYRAVPGGAR
ncbi:hypothetical protein [Brachybacterium sacelli]|uniref:Pilus assembly protein TadE n=1 Tax=Brachybacterium sacelli TaxID=173364 RepID=A0ABS4X5R9_9MICO|nr:hypothetical protein [Brachybacterium sacelli]MBP2383588.1 hypothetical protein [Brachybacterium sacelli]